MRRYTLDGVEIDILKFLADNKALSIDAVVAILALRVGEVFAGGGGASPTWIVARVNGGDER
jgi:hypothetical protein